MNITGSGGGKSGGSSGGLSEDPDTLSSVAFANVVDIISEGEIFGLVNGDQSIYLDGVPLRSVEGTANYRPYTYSAVNGTQDQGVIPGFAGTQSEVQVGLVLRTATGMLVRQIPDVNADAVRVTLSVNGLNVTDTKSGKIGKGVVHYRISIRVQGGTWVVAIDDKIDGKTEATYQRAYEILLSTLGPGPYEVGVERVTPDSTSSLIVDLLYWYSYTILNYEQFTYPNTAAVGISVDGRYFSQLPARTYHIKGLLIQVPDNYDPETGTYTGVWTGNFKTAYSNNPAWVFYDLSRNTRYGLGNRISAAQFNKWSAYAIGRYCDEMVPTGLNLNVFDAGTATTFSAKGGTLANVPVDLQNMERRFTCNVFINTADDAYKVLNMLSSVFRGMSYWSTNQIILTQDRPTDPTMIWNNTNVQDGKFHYEGSSRAQRHTVVTVGWNDPAEDFTQKFEYVEDRDGIQRYGVVIQETTAFACTSRSQARRFGLWLLYTERLEANAITFTTGMDTANVRPGDVGLINDNKRLGARWAGRLTAYSGHTLTLDAPLTLAADTYTVTVLLSDGTLGVRSLTLAAGTYTSLTFAGDPFTVLPTSGALWGLSSTTVVPMQVRVITVKENADRTYTLTVLENNPDKYDAIELGVYLHQPDYSLLSYNKVGDITNLKVTENSYKTDIAFSTITNLEISWDAVTDPLLRGYRVTITSLVGGKQLQGEVTDSSYTFTGVEPGQYTVDVAGVNYLGIYGTSAFVTMVVTGLDIRPPLDPINFVATMVSSGVQLSWTPDTDRDYFESEIHAGTVWNNSDAPIFRGAANTYTVPRPAVGTYHYLLKHRDSGGNLSTNALGVSVDVDAAAAGSWQGLTGIPANIAALTGSEDIENSLLLPSIVATVARLDVIDDDNKLSPGEKPDVVKDYTVILDEQVNIDQQADLCGITTLKANYDQAIYNLVTYLATLQTPTPWNDLDGDTAIDGPTFYDRFVQVYSARQKLLTEIARVSGTTAVWTTVIDRPLDTYNMLRTPNFELGELRTWNGNGVVDVAGQAWKRAMMTTHRDTLEYGNKIYVNVGELLYFQAEIDAHVCTANVSFGFEYHDQNGGTLGWVAAVGVPAGTSGWQKVNGNATVPAGTNYILGWVQIGGVPDQMGPAYITNMYIGRAQPGATFGADWSANLTGIPYSSVYNNDDSVALGFSMEDWPDGQTYPTGWQIWAGITPTKETTLVRAGNSAVRWSGVNGGNVGMLRQADFASSPLPPGTFLGGTFDVFLPAVYSAGRPLILVDLLTSEGGYARTAFPCSSSPTGAWVRTPWSARAAANLSITGIRIYVMASWDGAPQPGFVGDVIFDNLMFALYDSSTDNKSLNLSNTGQLSTGGQSLGSVSITGLGYAGDLNATYGADWTSNVTNINGNVRTVHLSLDAATEVLATVADSVDVTGYYANSRPIDPGGHMSPPPTGTGNTWSPVATLNFTPDVDCDVLITVLMNYTGQYTSTSA